MGGLAVETKTSAPNELLAVAVAPLALYWLSCACEPPVLVQRRTGVATGDAGSDFPSPAPPGGCPPGCYADLLLSQPLEEVQRPISRDFRGISRDSDWIVGLGLLQNITQH